MRVAQTFVCLSFWANGPALKCQLAAMSLVLMDYNIDRCFWTIGPGGVGQSLLTHFIHNIFNGLHAFTDTNIYYSDDELRKQAETLVGELIVTAQESVEGSSKSVRQDFYKKHMSADHVPARLPNGIFTKLVELVGWKLFEMNSLIKFAGVTNGNFDSIFRRGFATLSQCVVL